MFLRGKRKERRRAARVAGPALAAFYWTGGVSHPRRIRNISRNGAYIETETDWYVGTVLHIVLERPASCQPSPEATKPFGLWARVIHTDSCGMGIEFIMKEREEKREFNRFLETTIEKFGVNLAATFSQSA